MVTLHGQLFLFPSLIILKLSLDRRVAYMVLMPLVVSLIPLLKKVLDLSKSLLQQATELMELILRMPVFMVQQAAIKIQVIP